MLEVLMKLSFPSLVFATFCLLPLVSHVQAAENVDAGPAPSAEELKAYTELSSKGVLVQPLAAGVNWRYVNFRGAEKPDSALYGLLKGAVSIVELDLTGQKVTDADVAHISGLKNLKKLSLARSGVTDAGLAAVKDLGKLESLNLFQTQITDAGLVHVSGLKSLKRIYLFETKTTEAGVAKLKAALPGAAVELGAKLTVVPPPEPKKEEPKKEEPKKEPAKTEPPKPAAPKADAPKADAPTADAPKPAPAKAPEAPKASN